MEPRQNDPYGEAHRAAREAARAARETARAARHAAHHARRLRRHEIGKHWRTQTPWFLGTLLVGLGVLFLLHNLRLVNAGVVFRNMWPAIILAWGLSRVLFGHPGEKMFGAIAAIFGGVWLGDRYFDWDINIAGLFWPLLLIGLGFSMLFRPRRRFFPPPFPPPPSGSFGTGPSSGPSSFGAEATSAPFGEASSAQATGLGPDGANGSSASGQAPFDDEVYEDGAATIREFAFMSGIERRNISQVFRGGSLTALMGGIELDLRGCRMDADSVTILVQVVMGQVSLRLPQGWTVESHVGAALGNVEDRSDPPIEGAPKRLIIEGSVFMGQVEIRN